MHFHVLIVVGLGSRCFATDVTHVWLLASMHLLVLRQIVTAREQLTAHIALVSSRLLMLPHMTNAVILAYELTSTHVARVRPAIVV